MPTRQLEIEDITDIPEKYHRLISLNPEPFYKRIYDNLPYFSHFKRFNTLKMEVLFPQYDKQLCACGCGNLLSGRQRRWADKDCTRFAMQVFDVICGKSDSITKYLWDIKGYDCELCGIDYHKAHELYYKPTKSGIVNSQIHLDHILPVHQGGGGCWLGNYQFLCVGCHREKTIKERIF